MVNLHLDIRIQSPICREAIWSHELLSRDDFDTEGNAFALSLDIASPSLLRYIREHFNLAKTTRFQDVATLIGSRSEHCFVHLHTKIMGLPIQSSHLHSAPPVGKRIEVHGC